ncbi:MAG: zinc ABC transporter substrate-binding protein [Oscillospiraceae bacterium]|nr:zinc ABC transporter substrate-binding protein [Oscillospiraceae bacterium]
MKRVAALLILICILIGGCASSETANVAATTLPVYEFTTRLCQGTDITVTRLVTESVSCLHDYTLQVSQMRSIESAEAVILSGAGLEEFLEDALPAASHVADASAGIPLICPEDGHDHDHEHDDHGHHHENDPHIWLSPANAAVMAENICRELCTLYPRHRAVFEANLTSLLDDLERLRAYGQETLAQLSGRELITFHDGFAYFAECFDLTILEAVEEESGSEAPASELIRLIGLVREHQIPAIFIETNGSDAAAQIIAAETGIPIYTLDMAMAGDSYFDAMYRNIDTIKEALG